VSGDLLKLWEVEDFENLGTPVPKKSYHHLGLSPMRPNELETRPKITKEKPWHKSLVVNVVVVGAFEEEEEGTGVASDIVKVEGEDPAIPGHLI